MAGVLLGMKRGGVITLSPETVMYERDLTRETGAQREVGMSLMKFSPDVALLEEATVIVEVGASLRLFGGLLSLCKQAKAMLAPLGLTARISAAPTGQGAWLLAKRAKGPGAQRVLQLASLERALLPLPMLAVPEIRPFADWFAGLGSRQSRTYAVCLAPVCSAAAGNICWIRWIAPSVPRRSCSTGSNRRPLFPRIELPDRLEHADGALFAALV